MNHNMFLLNKKEKKKEKKKETAEQTLANQQKWEYKKRNANIPLQIAFSGLWFWWQSRHFALICRETFDSDTCVCVCVCVCVHAAEVILFIEYTFFLGQGEQLWDCLDLGKGVIPLALHLAGCGCRSFGPKRVSLIN